MVGPVIPLIYESNLKENVPRLFPAMGKMIWFGDEDGDSGDVGIDGDDGEDADDGEDEENGDDGGSDDAGSGK